jgi:hypothetical protein
MRILWLACAAALTACGTTSSQEPQRAGEPIPRRVEVTPNQELRFHLAANEAVHQRIGSPPEDVWSAVLRTFDDLEIPPTRVDAAARVVASSSRLRSGRAFAGEPPASLINCGASIGGPVTMTHRVELSVQVSLRPAEGDATHMLVLVSGRADAPGTSSGSIQCRTTGRLEQRLAQEVELRLHGNG